jgi:hypothetical protein
MRLLNYLAGLPDAVLWLRTPQGLPQGGSQGLSRRQLPVSVCSTTTTVFLPVGTAISNTTATYVSRQDPFGCTTTISVSQSTTLTTVNSITSTYSGPPGNQTSTSVRRLSLFSMLKTVLRGCGWEMCSLEYVSRRLFTARSNGQLHGQAQRRYCEDATLDV